MAGSWGNTANGKVGSTSSTSGGWGNTANGPVNTAPPPSQSSHHGGIIGGLISAGKSVEHVTNDVGNYLGGQAETAAGTIAQIGGGLYTLGKAEAETIANDVKGNNNALNKAEWNDLLHGHLGRMLNEGAKFKGRNSPEAQVAGGVKALTVGQVANAENVFHHPGQNILNDVLTALPILGGAAGVAGRLADATSAARAGEDLGTVAQTAVRGTEPGVRTLKVRQLELPQGEGPAALKTTSVQLTAPRSYLGRGLAKIHDTTVQNALDQVPLGKSGPVARFGMKRVAKAVDEQNRIEQNLRNATATYLQHAPVKEAGISKEEGQLALALQSGKVLPEEAAQFWRGQSTPEAQHLADVADSLSQKGVLRLSNNQVVVDETKFPKLASTADVMSQAQGARESILGNREVLTPDTMASRKELFGGIIGGGIGKEAEIASREGGGFTSLKTSIPKQPQGLFARAAGKVIPSAKKPSFKVATGAGLQKGLLPAKTTQVVARSLKEANRFENTSRLREDTAALGSDIRQSSGDVLVAASNKAAEIPDHIKQILGKTESTLTPEDEKTLRDHFSELGDTILRRNGDAAVGERAPEGWKWVNEKLVPDSLRQSLTPRGKLEKGANLINSAVTAATVYLKLGHLPQRLLTNGTTNALHGGLNPIDLTKTWKVAQHLTDQEKVDLTSITGTHGYQALPAEGEGVIAKVARAGASGWARHVDAPFRLNSILYELRRAGYETPDQIRHALKVIKDPTGAGAAGHELMKINGAVRRANRAAMMYDGLSAAEKRNVARYLWFYPWTKAAVRFAGHTAIEHPGKTAILGALGEQGKQQQKNILGAVPSFEQNLTPIGGGKSQFPLTANFSSLMPFGTTADVLNAVRQPLGQEGVTSFLNPVNAGVLQGIITGHEKGTAAGLKAFGGQALSPTPEFQAIAAGTQPRGSGALPTSSKFLFGRSAESTLLRGVVGAAFPRRVNVSKLHQYAAREHEKKKTITIYSK